MSWALRKHLHEIATSFLGQEVGNIIIRGGLVRGNLILDKLCHLSQTLAIRRRRWQRIKQNARLYIDRAVVVYKIRTPKDTKIIHHRQDHLFSSQGNRTHLNTTTPTSSQLLPSTYAEMFTENTSNANTTMKAATTMAMARKERWQRQQMSMRLTASITTGGM